MLTENDRFSGASEKNASSYGANGHRIQLRGSGSNCQTRRNRWLLSFIGSNFPIMWGCIFNFLLFNFFYLYSKLCIFVIAANKYIIPYLDWLFAHNLIRLHSPLGVLHFVCSLPGHISCLFQFTSILSIDNSFLQCFVLLCFAES